MFGRYGYTPVHCEHVCGLYYNVPYLDSLQKSYLPQVEVKVHASILATTSRTRLQQTFQNPSTTRGIREVRYAFPLYDGVSVVGFQCHVGNRLIVGEVKEKEKAKKVYKDAVERGETAGLLEQLPEASDVFTTTIGNIPPGAKVTVDITYVGELKHDMEVDGVRFTIPTSICPRYGSVSSGHSGSLQQSNGTIAITVDAEMAEGSFIQRLQSPSHPISMSMGTTSVDPDATPSMSKASAMLSLGVAHLDTDFVLQVIAKDTGTPRAILETHPKIPNQRALMATLVPKFALPPEKPEVVFVCDQSGSMSGPSMNLAKEALQVFLKSLPVGVKFNICSFGSRHSFLFPRSASYSQDTLATAIRHATGLSAKYGGTEMLEPLRATIQQRYKDMPLDIILLTDGEIWEQQQVFDYLNAQIQDTGAPIRVFTLGIGSGVSHSLIEGIAKAGNGFAQSVQEGERMNSKVVRMLKGALSPHVNDYTLEVKYSATEEDDFEVVEKVADSLHVKLDLNTSASNTKTPLKKISLFDTTSNPNTSPPTTEEDRYAHLPSIPNPKILQAPQTIPSLFAFNRTTVYLLLGSTAPTATPVNVILRGTSAHGPLELEIPVQVLEKKGETVHQLAAKKAVSELEQGRGWLACAQAADDTLLKNKFEGRFSDMLEREAVRLGVQFQVGGKWCSFVATETTSKTSKSSDGDVDGEGEPMEEDWEYLEDEKAAELEGEYRQEIGSQRFDGRESKQISPSSPPYRGGGALGVRGGLMSSLRTLPPGVTSQQRFGGQMNRQSPAMTPNFSPFGAASAASTSSAQLFGAAPAVAPSASLFGGAPANCSKPAFGAVPFTGGLFGSSSTSSKPSTGGLFGSPASHNSSTLPFGPRHLSTPSAFSTTSTTTSSSALQDYQTSLMALPQENPQRLHMAPAAFAAASPFAPAAPASAGDSASASPTYSPSSPPVNCKEERSDEDMGFGNFGNTPLSRSLVLASTPVPLEVAADTSVLEQYPREFAYSARTGSLEENNLDTGLNFGDSEAALETFGYDSLLHVGGGSAGFSGSTGFDDSANGEKAGADGDRTGSVKKRRRGQRTTSMQTATSSPFTPSYSSQETLHYLIAHQSFSGVFPYHARVFGWLSISDVDFRRVLREMCGDVDEVKGGYLLTTALVIVYMEKKLAEFKGEWELVVEKARSWLEEEREGRDGGADVYLKAAANLVQDQGS